MMAERVKVEINPRIFRDTWKLQFEIAHRRRRKKVIVGAIVMAVAVAAYFIFYNEIARLNFIFFTGLVGVVAARELIRTGSYLWDRLHHFGWIKENVKEETEKQVAFTLREDGFDLYYEDYDISYRWPCFEGYFEEGGFLWLLDHKGEMVYVLSEPEIPGQWEQFRKLVLSNVEEVDATTMKP